MKKRVALARALVLEPGAAAARRADQPPRHRGDRVARGAARRLRRRGAVRHPRPALPRPRGHPHRRARPRPARRASRQLQRLRGAQGRAARASRRWRTRKFDKLLAQEEAWIRQGVEARRTRNEGRVRRLEQLRLERAARRDRVGTVDLARRRGRALRQAGGRARARRASAYGDKRGGRGLLRRILRGDKVGLIGPNGCGKTTLLKLILGEIAPDAGTRAPGHEARGRLLRPVPRRSSTRRPRSPTRSRRAPTSSRSAARASTSSATSATSCSRRSARARR